MGAKKARKTKPIASTRKSFFGVLAAIGEEYSRAMQGQREAQNGRRWQTETIGGSLGMSPESGDKAIIRESMDTDSGRDFAQVAVDLQPRAAVGLFGRRLISALRRFVGRVGHWDVPAPDYR